MDDLTIHPVVGSLPEIDAAQFAVLLDDIRANGQDRPIVLLEGMIWDGRARYRACKRLNVAPWLVPWRGDHPVRHFIKANIHRAGDPSSEERQTLIAKLWALFDPERERAARERKKAWLSRARADFEAFERRSREACEVCGQHVAFTNAHHLFPLAYQYECGIPVTEADHECVWLCPVHHRYVHAALSHGLLGIEPDLHGLARETAATADEFERNFISAEAVAIKGLRLCCRALGEPDSSSPGNRYDPPYGMFLASNCDWIRPWPRKS